MRRLYFLAAALFSVVGAVPVLAVTAGAPPAFAAQETEGSQEAATAQTQDTEPVQTPVKNGVIAVPGQDDSDSSSPLALDAFLQAGNSQVSALPERYCAADAGIGKKPTVKSQGNVGTCWAIASTSALESAWLPEKETVFSADHMTQKNDFDISIDEGGDYYMIMSYLSGWKGPVLEKLDPYGDGYSPDGLPAAAHVQEMRLLAKLSMREVKDRIRRFGTVQSSLNLSRSMTAAGSPWYRKDTAAYFVPLSKTLDHDVVVLGWDDSYPKENFATEPQRDGAWICQNSWGSDFGEDGIFYVSYDDANLFSHGGICYSRVDAPDNYKTILQNDSLGWQGRLGYGREEAYFACVFTAPTSSALAAVGFYTTGRDSIYRVGVIRGYEGPDSLEKAEFQAGGWIEDAGFTTIDFENAVPLDPGERFAVVVWIDTPGQERPVAVEMAKDKYTAGVTTEGRETYLSRDGSVWENTQEEFSANVCLKAYLN